MSKPYYQLSVLIFAISMIAGSLRAQSTSNRRFLVGVKVAYNLIAYNTDAFSVLDTKPGFYLVENGSGQGLLLGAICERPLDEGVQNFIVFEISYDHKSSRFEDMTAAMALTQRYDTEYSLAADLSYYLLNVGYKFNFWGGLAPNGLGIQVCASVGLIDRKNFDRTLYIIDSANQANNQTVQEPVPISNVESFRFAIRTELTYDIPLFANWLLTPSVGYDAPLTKVDPSLNWRASSLYFAMAVQFGL